MNPGCCCSRFTNHLQVPGFALASVWHAESNNYLLNIQKKHTACTLECGLYDDMATAVLYRYSDIAGEPMEMVFVGTIK